MKIKKILLCISFVLIMFLSTTNVYASGGVTIKSIDLVDKSINTTEASKARANGLIMDFDLKFKEVNDYAKYKIVVENKDNKDYKISVDSNFENSKYISYKYDNADILKANSDTEFYVTVTYNKKLDESNYVDGKYSEKNSAVLKLSDGVNNPKTFNNSWSLIILVVMCVTLIFLFRNKKNRGLNVLVLFSLLSVPLFVKAIDYLKITVNSNVVIEKGYSVGYNIEGFIKASEVDNYDLSHAERYAVVYSDSVSEDNKYVYYYNILYKEKGLHSVGETVKVNPTLPKLYSFDNTECTELDGTEIPIQMVSGVSYIPEEIICGMPTKVENFDDYSYDVDTMEQFGYQYNKDDNVVMHFSNAIDKWDSLKFVTVYKGSTFKMPNHDVLFTYTN